VLRYRRIKALCVLAGRTSADVARSVGIKPAVLTQVQGGHTAPWPSLRSRLAAEFGVSEEWLFSTEPMDAERDLPTPAELAARERISVKAAEDRLWPVRETERRHTEASS